MIYRSQEQQFLSLSLPLILSLSIYLSLYLSIYLPIYLSGLDYFDLHLRRSRWRNRFTKCPIKMTRWPLLLGHVPFLRQKILTSSVTSDYNLCVPRLFGVHVDLINDMSLLLSFFKYGTVFSHDPRFKSRPNRPPGVYHSHSHIHSNSHSHSESYFPRARRVERVFKRGISSMYQKLFRE